MKKIVLLFLLFAFPLFAQAAGIQVSPSRLSVTVTGQESSTNLVVVNPTADVQLFQVSADEFSDIITPLQRSFTIEAGGRKEVTISLYRGDAQTGSIRTTNISVVSRPLLDTGLSVYAGVKIPITISYTEQENIVEKYTYRIAVILIIVLLVALLLNKFKRRMVM